MALFTYLGKTLIVASILFQAFLLYQDKQEGDQFHRNLVQATAHCSCLKSVQPYLEQYLRLAVIGLLASSAFMLVIKCSLVKVLTLLGLIILLWVEQHSVFCKIPSIDLLNNTPFFHSLGVIGAVLYLAGAECQSCNKASKDAKPVQEKSSEKIAPSKGVEKQGKKGKKE